MANVTFHRVSTLRGVSVCVRGDSLWLSIDSDEGDVTWFFETKEELQAFVEGVIGQLKVEVKHEI